MGRCHLVGREQASMLDSPGLAQGFLVLSDSADFEYKCTGYYDPNDEGCLIWNDPAIGIEWPIEISSDCPILSDKDKLGLSLIEF